MVGIPAAVSIVGVMVVIVVDIVGANIVVDIAVVSWLLLLIHGLIWCCCRRMPIPAL